MVQQAYTNGFSRVWFQEGGPGPSRARSYHGNWQAGAVAWDQGALTTIREPDPNAYGRFVRVGRFRAAPGDPTLPIMARYTYQRSALLKAARARCDHTIQVHMGKCENPQDFARGWEKVLILEQAAITAYNTEGLGAMSPDQNAAVNEDIPFTGTDLYEVTRMNFAETGGTPTTREIIGITVCDSVQCGACGVSSDGCQVILALEGGITASPGQAPTVVYTRDGGATWAEVPISTLAANQVGSAILCVGSNVIVLSTDNGAVHYTDLAALTLGNVAWAAVTTGFVVAHDPIAAFSNGATDTWIVGEGGYIYHTSDPTLGVQVSDAGTISAQDLNAIHFVDSLNGVAVGASNAVVHTANGGATWELIVGPQVGAVLNTVWMRSATEWFIGSATLQRLWYTIDGGATWTEKTHVGSGIAGQVRSIVFATPSVGYMAISTTVPHGRILRTIDGGYSWYVMPEGSGSIPVNDYVSRLAVCDDPNIVFGAGLGDNAVDGYIVKGA